MTTLTQLRTGGVGVKQYQPAPQRRMRGGVEDRWYKRDGTPTARHGQGLRWLVRWVDDLGEERTKSFRTKAPAEQHWKEVSSSQVTGTYVDPRLGKITLATFYRDWSTRQVWVRGTRLGMNRAVGQTTFGDVPLAELRRSHFEQWVKSMDDRGLAPSTISTYYTNVRAVIGAALRERLLGHDVGDRVKLPRQLKDKDKMRLPTPEAVKALRAATPPELEAFVSLCAFAGLRRGEAEALKVSDIDFFGKKIHVRRQVQGTCAANLEIVAAEVRVGALGLRVRRGARDDVRTHPTVLPRQGSRPLDVRQQDPAGGAHARLARCRARSRTSWRRTFRYTGPRSTTCGRRRARPPVSITGCMICGTSSHPV